MNGIFACKIKSHLITIGYISNLSYIFQIFITINCYRFSVFQCRTSNIGAVFLCPNDYIIFTINCCTTLVVESESNLDIITVGFSIADINSWIALYSVDIAGLIINGSIFYSVCNCIQIFLRNGVKLSRHLIVRLQVCTTSILITNGNSISCNFACNFSCSSYFAYVSSSAFNNLIDFISFNSSL